MNAIPQTARAFGRSTAQTRPHWPDTPLTVDPETMHPRAVEMAETMREGANTFKALICAGFTTAEIAEFRDDALSLARALSERQVSPGADMLREMVDKARAAIANRMPMPKGAGETQAMVVAWNHYCVARNAFALDAWSGQRERCITLLRTYFSVTPAGTGVTEHVIRETAATMRVKH